MTQHYVDKEGTHYFLSQKGGWFAREVHGLEEYIDEVQRLSTQAIALNIWLKAVWEAQPNGKLSDELIAQGRKILWPEGKEQKEPPQLKQDTEADSSTKSPAPSKRKESSSATRAKASTSSSQ